MCVFQYLFELIFHRIFLGIFKKCNNYTDVSLTTGEKVVEIY